MKFKLKPDYFTTRLPLIIRRRNNTIYFLLQHVVARSDGYRADTFVEYDKISTNNIREIGLMAIKLLDRFHEISDFTVSSFEEMLSHNENGLPNEKNLFKFHGVKNLKDLVSHFDECTIMYYIHDDYYTFVISWHRKNSVYSIDCKSSLGEKSILTFDEPLEFKDYSDPQKLGELIVEALDRSKMISDKAAGNTYPSKPIELVSGDVLNVSAPRDKHFIDNDDYGVGELYQAYMYFPREDSEEASAVFYVGIAAELDCDMSEDNIRNAWEKQNGKAELFEVKPTEYGIFKLRAEMRNKSIHQISYLLQIDESELLDCTMELRKPNSRKKLDEKLTGLFEEFARQCKFKD